MTVRPVGNRTHRVEFLMPAYAHTGYDGKHNHRGTVAHRFLVELSYARESTKTTPMTELAKLINYAEVYKVETHHAYVGHSRTYSDLSKIAIYVPMMHAKRVEELLFELRHYLGIITGGESHGEKGHIIFNTCEIQDYLAD